MAILGTCRICGTEDELSFEHVPPRAAFNNHRIFEADIDALRTGKWSPGERIEDGKYKQRGAGAHTLCGRCNSITGHWYGGACVEVAKQAMVRLHASRGTCLSLRHLPVALFETGRGHVFFRLRAESSGEEPGPC